MWKNILGNLLKRWASKSPKRYKIATNVSLIVGIGLGIASVTPLGLPIWAITLMSYGSSIALVVSGGSKLTVDNNK